MPKKPAPEMDAMEDTISDEINPEDFDTHSEDKAKRARSRSSGRTGPKRVRSQTTKILGDGVAAGVLLATKQADSRKDLTPEEAQSIGHPTVRMLSRRVPGWLKPLMPKTNLSPDDAADIEEIIATLARWGVRVLSVAVQDIMAAAERRQKNTVEGTVTHERAAQPPKPEPAKQPEPAAANGYHPFDALRNIDYGFASGE